MPELPPLEWGGYLSGYLFEIGPVSYGGMGAAPLSHLEIQAWCDLIDLKLSPGEARILRRLSIEYLNEQQKAGKIGCPAPWGIEGQKPMISDAQLALRALAQL